MNEEQNPLPKKRGRPPADHEERKKQLLVSAEKMFLEKGFHVTRIEDIIADAKTGKGTFYIYFKDKEDILGHILESFFLELKEILDWASDNLVSEGSSLLEMFQIEAKRIFLALKAHKNVAMIMSRESFSSGPNIEEKILKFYKDLTDICENTLLLAMKLGLMPKINAHIASLCILGSIEKVYLLWAQDKIIISDDEMIQEILGFLLRGCGYDLDILNAKDEDKLN